VACDAVESAYIPNMEVADPWHTSIITSCLYLKHDVLETRFSLRHQVITYRDRD
jgi:hypothetical protein